MIFPDFSIDHELQPDRVDLRKRVFDHLSGKLEQSCPYHRTAVTTRSETLALQQTFNFHGRKCSADCRQSVVRKIRQKLCIRWGQVAERSTDRIRPTNPAQREDALSNRLTPKLR